MAGHETRAGGILGVRSSVLGVLTWAIPFAAAFLMVDHTGRMLLPQPLFKSLMSVIGGGVGTVLLVAALGRIGPTLRNGLALGAAWMAISLALDLAVLVPMARMSVSDYLQDIGLRYLMLPIVGAAMGAVAERARRSA